MSRPIGHTLTNIRCAGCGKAFSVVVDEDWKLKAECGGEGDGLCVWWGVATGELKARMEDGRAKAIAAVEAAYDAESEAESKWW